MGFRSDVSEVALKEYKTVQTAIDAILAGKGRQTDMYIVTVERCMLSQTILQFCFLFSPFMCILIPKQLYDNMPEQTLPNFGIGFYLFFHIIQ